MPSPTTTWRWAAGSDPAVRATIVTSTEQVPSRARNLIALLEGLANVAGFEGRRVLESGMWVRRARYISWRGTQWPAELVATARPDRLRSARVEAFRHP